MAMMATDSGLSVDRPPGGCGSIGDGGVGYGQDECKFHILKNVIIFFRPVDDVVQHKLG